MKLKTQLCNRACSQDWLLWQIFPVRFFHLLTILCQCTSPSLVSMLRADNSRNVKRNIQLRFQGITPPFLDEVV